MSESGLLSISDFAEFTRNRQTDIVTAQRSVHTQRGSRFNFIIEDFVINIIQRIRKLMLCDVVDFIVRFEKQLQRFQIIGKRWISQRDFPVVQINMPVRRRDQLRFVVGNNNGFR